MAMTQATKNVMWRYGFGLLGGGLAGAGLGVAIDGKNGAMVGGLCGAGGFLVGRKIGDWAGDWQAKKAAGAPAASAGGVTVPAGP